MTKTESRERSAAAHRGPSSMGLRTVRWSMAHSFGLEWGFMRTPVLFADRIESMFGPVRGSNPVFILGVWSPANAGVVLVWLHHGRSAGRQSPATRDALEEAASVVGVPAAGHSCGQGRGAAINGAAGDFPCSPWYTLLPALGLAVIVGPVEELGWRGVARPLLQRRFAPLWASLIVGAFWGLWHAPAFLKSGPPLSGWVFAPYVVGVLALSVIVTKLFNAAHGSILMAALVHVQMSAPAWPNAQPWENDPFALIAVAVMAVNRKVMLSREDAATGVLMPATASDDRERRPGGRLVAGTSTR